MSTSNVPFWDFAGGKTTIIKGLAATNADLSDWYSQVIAFVETLAGSSDFEVIDNGYVRFPGVLVTDGIDAFFRGNPFQVWSDLPGELILCHGAMGSRNASQLIRSLEALWTPDQGQVTTDK